MQISQCSPFTCTSHAYEIRSSVAVTVSLRPFEYSNELWNDDAHPGPESTDAAAGAGYAQAINPAAQADVTNQPLNAAAGS